MNDSFSNLYNSIINESILDFTRNSLDPSVFEFPEDHQPIMHPAIKLQIMQDVEGIGKIAPVVEYFIVGSILSYNYSEKTDIDVTVRIDPTKMDAIDKDNMFQNIKRINGRMAYGTTHPIYYYIIEDEYDYNKTQGAYDVANEKWLKEPEQIDINLNSYIDKIQNSVNNIDLAIAELRRDIIDYDELKSLTPKQIKHLKQLTNAKLEEIEDKIISLLRSYDDIRLLRRFAYERELTPFEIKKYGKRYKLPENVIYKLLERYYYIDFVKALKNLIGDKQELQKQDVNKVKQLGQNLWK